MADGNGQNDLKKYLTVHAVTLVVMIAVQTIGLVWWASSINTRVGHLECVDEKLERVDEKMDARIRSLEVAEK